MRIFTLLAILLFAFPIAIKANAPDSVLRAERDNYYQKYQAAAAIDSGKVREIANLELKMEQLEARAVNDMWMLWILKTAAGLMIFIILLLLYLLINAMSKLNRLK